ncbi:murein hydrolase activator EnvC [Methylococcus sp. EFPC2]|uniref:murein hydrolase activator EnvC family protein n=1 Tax=Methylococcus sp. EFPC2 TaxID=2812648 RepID=UPI00196812E9|nr:peptidoglycan DD-metalloendopeptidase family protein [Methylococcus sp. EFPC2]QSA96016.1 peptidoglycan DD-metalloendopeptidase family protein [Methylococcus sp. EFPC2]
MRGLARILGLVVLALPTAGADAGEREEKDRELHTLRGKIRIEEVAVGGLESQKSDLSSQLGALERRYGELSKSLRDLENQARSQERQLDDLKRQRAELRVGILQHNRTLIAQTRAAYADGRREWLKLALNQDDPARASRMLAYYGYLNRARSAQLQILDRSLAGTRELEAKLLAEAERLNSTRARIAREQADLEASRKQRRELMAGLEHELKDRGGRLKRLRDDVQRLQDLIAALPETAPPESRGAPDEQTPSERAAWPVQGPLLARFGSPRLSGQWDGVLIGAQEGSPVRAVARGRVVYADWLRGYGLLIIVDHGTGHLSLYAFNQSLHKALGDWVEAGDIIASVGSSGGRSEPGLYFGVRENGRPINPLQWSGRGN